MTLSIEHVSVAYDGVPAVVDATVEVPDGEVLAVLGPSGCGKSTLLRAVAGLEPTTAGAIAWDGRDLAGVPTHKRGFALMFQDGQLFTHLTVARNVGYALRLRRAPNIRARVDELLALVGLEGYGDRLPGTLSGGERQRVALARSLAVEPRLLLLDEPLSALDAGMRERLAGDLSDILSAAGTTAVLVTHDHEEAFAVADRIAVMRAGRIVQRDPSPRSGPPPQTPETALFLGYARVVHGDGRAHGSFPVHRRSPSAARHCRWARPGPWRARWSPCGRLRSRCAWSWTSRGSVRWMPSLRSTGATDRGTPVRLAVDHTRLAAIPGDVTPGRSLDSAGCIAAPTS